MKSLVAPILFYMAVCAFCVVAVAVPSCSGTNCTDPKNASSATCSVINSVIDCTGVTSLPAAVTAAKPIVEDLIAGARQADGSINWSSIEQKLIDIALQYGPCVLAEIWNDLVGQPATTLAIDAGVGSGSNEVPPPAPPMQAATGKLKLDPMDAKAEFGRLRARIAPGKGFKTSGGTL